MELGGSHTALGLLHTDSAGPTLLCPLHPTCNTPCSIGPWDPCTGHVREYPPVGNILCSRGATASPEGWWRHEIGPVIPGQVGTAGSYWHPPKVKTAGDLPAGSPVTQGSGRPGRSISIGILLGAAAIASVSVSLTRLSPKCPTLGQVLGTRNRTGVLTMFCHRLLGTVVAVGQAGQPQKWVHKENLTCP